MSVMALVGILLTACGTENSQMSPQEVVNTVLQESDEEFSYYGEYEMVSSEGEEEYAAKEWVRKDGKRRMEMVDRENDDEMIMVSDGKTITMYDKADNTAMIMEMNEEDMAELGEQTPRQQAEMMLDMVKDSHELSTGEEVEIAGRSTYHIIAKAKEDTALLGDVELWVDKETWLPLKTVTTNSGLDLTVEYTTIDFEADMDDSLFEIDLPEDVEVEVVDNELPEKAVVTVEDVLEELGAFYQLSDDDFELNEITVLEGFEDRSEFSFEYEKDGMTAFSITVFKDLQEVADIGAIGGEEETTVRGQEATKMEMGEFRSLDWEEDGLKYVVLIENPTIEFDDLTSYLEDMELVE